MSYQTIIVENSEGVATITLNRPEVLNAMNHVLVGELDQAMSEAEEDDSIAAIILTGAGDRAFSAGADIHEQREDATKRESGELTEDEDRLHRATRSQASWHVGSASKPTIGALNGLSYGGGSVLASSLDIRVGCERSRFRFLAAAYGRLNCTWTLPQQVGWPIAKELLFTGRVVEPDEAHRIGLLNHLVSHDRVIEKAREIAVTIAGNNQNSVRGLKKLLMEDVGSGFQDMWERERNFLRDDFVAPHVEDSFKEFIERKGRS